MKKALLVDDDSFFRTMFASMISWTDYGFSLLQAGNGQEAIDLIHKHSDIALVFTDMNMPILDGMELIRYIAEQCRGIRCIALSAYDDFTYVRSSLKNGADDYLLKHTLTKAQLTQLLERYAAPGERTGAAGQETSELNERFLYDYITGVYRNVADLDRLFASLSLPDLRENILLMVLCGDTSDGAIPFRNVQTQRNAACCMIQNSLDRIGTGLVFSGPEDGLIYLLLTAEGFENLQFVKQTTQMLTSQIEKMMLRYFNLHTGLLCAPLSRRREDLYESYKALMKQANREVKEEVPETQTPIRLPELGQLLDELYFGTEESLRAMVSQGYLTGRQQHMGIQQFSKLTLGLLQLIGQAEKALKKMEPSGLAFPEGNDTVQEALVVRRLLELKPLAAEAASGRYSPVVYRALKLIHREFQNCALSPAAISERLNVNPAYLSRLFKAQTEKNLTDYISEKRLKLACRLLDDDTYTVKDVAELCGYDNYNYFFKVFKKNFDITPKEYRTQAESNRRQ